MFTSLRRRLQIASSIGLRFISLMFVMLALPAQAVDRAVEPACHLLAHLNENKETVAKEGLTLPRWYELHHRLLTLLTDEAGCTLEVIGSPWSRSLTLLEQGKIDLMLTMSYT